MARPNPAHATRFPSMDLSASSNLVSCVLDDDVSKTDPGVAHLLFTCAFARALADYEEGSKRTRVLGATQSLDEGHIQGEAFLAHVHATVGQRLRTV